MQQIRFAFNFEIVTFSGGQLSHQIVGSTRSDDFTAIDDGDAVASHADFRQNVSRKNDCVLAA